MGNHTYEVSYAKGSERLKYVTNNKLEALYLYYKMRHNKRFDNDCITFKIDDTDHEVVNDDINEKIVYADIQRNRHVFNLDAIIEEG